MPGGARVQQPGDEPHGRRDAGGGLRGGRPGRGGRGHHPGERPLSPGPGRRGGPLPRACGHVVVLDHTESGTSQAADVVLPVATYAESTGHVRQQRGQRPALLPGVPHRRPGTQQSALVRQPGGGAGCTCVAGAPSAVPERPPAAPPGERARRRPSPSRRVAASRGPEPPGCSIRGSSTSSPRRSPASCRCSRPFVGGSAGHLPGRRHGDRPPAASLQRPHRHARARDRLRAEAARRPAVAARLLHGGLPGRAALAHHPPLLGARMELGAGHQQAAARPRPAAARRRRGRAAHRAAPRAWWSRTSSSCPRPFTRSGRGRSGRPRASHLRIGGDELAGPGHRRVLARSPTSGSPERC